MLFYKKCPGIDQYKSDNKIIGDTPTCVDRFFRPRTHVGWQRGWAAWLFFAAMSTIEQRGQSMHHQSNKTDLLSQFNGQRRPNTSIQFPGATNHLKKLFYFQLCFLDLHRLNTYSVL